MCTAHTSALRFYLGPYLQPITLQLEAGPKPHPRMQTGPSLQRKGPGRETLLLQAPNCKPSLLSKLTLAPATFSYLATTSFTATMSRRLDTKTVISSANAEILARTLLLSKIPHRAGRAPPSLSLRSRGSRART